MEVEERLWDSSLCPSSHLILSPPRDRLVLSPFLSSLVYFSVTQPPFSLKHVRSFCVCGGGEAAAAAEPDLCHSSVPMKGTSQGSLFRRDVLTQPQHQPITELSSIAYNLLSFSLFCFILSLPSEGSSPLTRSQSGERINYPMLQHQSESIAEWVQELLNSGQPSIRSC